MTTPAPARAPRFHVDAWDPGYGGAGAESPEDTGSTARVVLDVERPEADWAPVPVPSAAPPSAVLFVDGVRRVDARVWLEDPAAGGVVRPGLCASYAAGVVCCAGDTAKVVATAVRRGLFTAAPSAADVATRAGAYPVRPAPGDEGDALSLALQRSLAELEVIVALQARAAVTADDEDLLVVDGPLRGRQHLPRALGLVKTHRATYLPEGLSGVVAALQGGERTPVFLMGTTWDRYSWYLRLPCRPGAPWAGVVRVECSADLPKAAATALADLSQITLCRHASLEYKDARAPQNLVPIAGLERGLRRQLGDAQLLHRALRNAAAAPRP